MAVDPAIVLNRWKRCKDKKDPWDAFILEILQYLCPRMTNKIAGRIASGSKQTTLQFDSAGEDAGQKLAASLSGSLMPNTQKWFRLVPREYALREIAEFMVWLEACADYLFAAFNNSNLIAEGNESFLALVYTGTTAMLMEEAKATAPGVFGGFRFRTLGYGEYCYEEDAFGVVNKLYRTFEISYSSAFSLWASAFTPEMARKMQEAPEEEFEVLHYVGPRAAYKRRYHDNLNMPYESCYIMTQNKILLSEGGFEEFRYAAPRWSKSPGEIYGRGPGHRAYADIRSQNRLQELDLEKASKDVDPTLMQLHEAIIGDTTLNPAGINIVDSAMVQGDVRKAIAPLESGGHYPWTAERLDRLEKKIRQAFYNDHLIIPEKPDMTATEFAGRQEVMQRMIGPTFGRLNNEFLAIIVNLGFNIMKRAGALPPMPLIPREFANTDIDVVFEGPLARAQRSHDLIAIQRKNDWLQIQVALGNESAKDLFDADEEGRELAEITGVPANIVRDKAAVAALRAEKAKAARANQAAEKLGQVAESAGKMAPALDKLPKTAGKMDKALAGV